MRILAIAAACALATTAANAADFPGAAEMPAHWAQSAPVTQSGVKAEFGVRYWLGFGKTSKDLYDIGGGNMVSRLTYDGLTTNSGELFGKVTANNFFVSGFAGVGPTATGNLQDEDFAPLTTPYSSTDSSQKRGSIGYATADLGYNFFQNSHIRLGASVGYNYFHQRVNGYGCTQTATNPGICVPSISNSVEVISQDNNWHSVRLGLNGQVQLNSKWRLSASGAYLPRVWLKGADTHWLRIPADFSGPIPEDGTGWGLQAQAMIDYSLTDHLSVGLGGRYWHMQASGNDHFEDVTTGQAQPVNWRTDMFGLLAEVKGTY